MVMTASLETISIPKAFRLAMKVQIRSLPENGLLMSQIACTATTLGSTPAGREVAKPMIHIQEVLPILLQDVYGLQIQNVDMTAMDIMVIVSSHRKVPKKGELSSTVAG
jgi:hypothetical protein